MAERTLDKPLVEEDFQELKKQLQITADIHNALNKYKSAGGDVGDQLTQNDARRKRIQALINTYFPGRS